MNLIFVAAAFICMFLLIRMFRVKQLTNFIVAHAVWILTIGISSILSLNLCYFNLTEECAVVKLMQLYMPLYAISGVSVLLGRLVDPDFRNSLSCRRKGNLLRGEQAKSGSSLESRYGEIEETLEVFKSLYAKVGLSQFVIDALLSLTMSISKVSSRNLHEADM